MVCGVRINYDHLDHRLHTMEIRVLCPPTQALSEEVEWNREDDREHGNGELDHVDSDPAVTSHDVEDPVTETESENVLENSANDHDLTGDGLVAIDSVGDGDGRDRCDCETRESEAADNDGLPWPQTLVANRSDDVSNDKEADVWDKCRKTHLSLAYAIILDGHAASPPVRERTSCQHANDAAHEESEVAVADGLWRPAICRRPEQPRLSQVEEQEQISWTSKHECGPEDDWVEEDDDRCGEIANEKRHPPAVWLRCRSVLRFARATLVYPLTVSGIAVAVGLRIDCFLFHVAFVLVALGLRRGVSGVVTVILRLRVAKDEEKSNKSSQRGGEPEEAAPTMTAANASSHDWSEECAREIEGEVHRHPSCTLVQEEHIRDRLHHDRFAGRCDNSVAGPRGKQTLMGRGQCLPNIRKNDQGPKEDRGGAAAENVRDWNDEDIGEAEGDDVEASEERQLLLIEVEFHAQEREQRRQRQC